MSKFSLFSGLSAGLKNYQGQKDSYNAALAAEEARRRELMEFEAKERLKSGLLQEQKAAEQAGQINVNAALQKAKQRTQEAVEKLKGENAMALEGAKQESARSLANAREELPSVKAKTEADLASAELSRARATGKAGTGTPNPLRDANAQATLAGKHYGQIAAGLFGIDEKSFTRATMAPEVASVLQTLSDRAAADQTFASTLNAAYTDPEIKTVLTSVMDDDNIPAEQKPKAMMELLDAFFQKLKAPR